MRHLPFALLALLTVGCSGAKGGSTTSSSSGASSSSGSTAATGSSGASSGTTSTSASSSTSSGTASSGTTSGSTGSSSSGSSGSVCGAQGGFCSGNADCCSGLGCFQNACSCAAHQGDSCADGVACCGGLTCDGTQHCRAACADAGSCRGWGDACASSAECCGQSTCQGGVCAFATAAGPSCQGEGQACASAGDCCGVGAGHLACVPADGGQICHLGAEGEACETGRPCQDGLTCNSGVCGITPTGHTCDLGPGYCHVGDACDPNSNPYGADPCFYSSSLSQRVRGSLICDNGLCRAPRVEEPCDPTPGCLQTPGDHRATLCAIDWDGSQLCRPSCTADADCTGTEVTDFGNNNPPPLDTWCVDNGAGKACVSAICYFKDSPADGGLDDPHALYQPCPGLAGSQCQPQYNGNDSVVAGFCQAVRPDAGSTVGLACDPFAGRESPSALCGADALCLGGVCRALCDAAQGGSAPGVPACADPTLTCVSPQGLNLISNYQVGGCGLACDPYADEAHSGCASFCGGPPSRCHWIVNDGIQPGQPPGYCEAQVGEPVPVGQSCTPRADGQETCESGSSCFATFPDGGGNVCLKLCLAATDAGAPDACPAGQSCQVLSGFNKTGLCQ